MYNVIISVIKKKIGQYKFDQSKSKKIITCDRSEKILSLQVHYLNNGHWTVVDFCTGKPKQSIKSILLNGHNKTAGK